MRAFGGCSSDVEGRRDNGVGVERVTRLSLFVLGRRSFGRRMRAFGGCSSATAQMTITGRRKTPFIEMENMECQWPS